ncbi:HAD-like domain containing protein, partial [Parasponia andersonii]
SLCPFRHCLSQLSPEFSDVVSNFQSNALPKELSRRKLITLLRDLDETLVHSTFDHCDDADFTLAIKITCGGDNGWLFVVLV